jgi:hypothetical protein
VINVSPGSQAVPEIDLQITKVTTFSVTVKLGDGTVLTDGITVALLQDGTVVDSTSTASAKNTFDFDNVVPGVYAVQVTGTTIRPQTDQTVTVSKSQTTHTVFVTLGASTVTGLVQGKQGKDPADAPLDGVRVQIGTGTATTFAVAKGTDGKNMDVTTPTTGASTGTYSLTNVPDGTWTVQLSSTGYQTQTITGVVVNHNNAATTLNRTLVRITHDVTLTITTTADGDDVKSAANVLLTSAADSTWTLTPQAPVSTARTAPAHGVVTKWTFLAVPYGSWALSLDLPTGHFGTLAATNGSAALSCTDGSPTTPVSCTTAAASPVIVPTTDDTSVVPLTYGLNEYSVGLHVVATKLASDPNVTPPSTVKLTVSDGANPVYQNDTFAVTTGSALTDSFWGAAGTTYTATGTSPAVNWTVTSTDLTSAAPKPVIPLVERGASVTVTLAGDTFPAGTNATVTLVPPAGSGIVAPASKTAASGGSVTFTGVPFGTGWTASATATYTKTAGTPPVTTTVTVSGTSAAFDITALTPPTVTITMVTQP